MALARVEKIADILLDSFLFNGARGIWEKNRLDIGFPLSKLQKIWVGAYVILEHYRKGEFPPTFNDQCAVYENEVAYHDSLPGVSSQEAVEADLRKPFWFGVRDYQFLKDLIKVCRFFEDLNIRPSMKLLELGCGHGWMAESLVLMGFDVTGTTISSSDVKRACKRIESIREKGLEQNLCFIESPMETVADNLPSGEKSTFDCVYVYEALHHAYSWEDTISSSFECLKPGGWLLICQEPNLIHTWVSYRISVLSNAHEIGMNRRSIIKHMRESGYRTVRILENRIGLGVRPIWLAAQK